MTDSPVFKHRVQKCPSLPKIALLCCDVARLVPSRRSLLGGTYCCSVLLRFRQRRHSPPLQLVQMPNLVGRPCACARWSVRRLPMIQSLRVGCATPSCASASSALLSEFDAVEACPCVESSEFASAIAQSRLPSRRSKTANGDWTLSRCAAISASAKKLSLIRGSLACEGCIRAATCGMSLSATTQKVLLMLRRCVKSVLLISSSKICSQISSGICSSAEFKSAPIGSDVGSPCCSTGCADVGMITVWLCLDVEARRCCSWRVLRKNEDFF